MLSKGIGNPMSTDYCLLCTGDEKHSFCATSMEAYLIALDDCRYADRAAHEAHQTAPYFLSLFRAFEDEKLLAKPVHLAIGSKFGGFVR